MRCQQNTGFNSINGVAIASPSFGIAFGFCLDSVQVGSGSASPHVIPNTYTDLTTLYDQYRIDKIQIKFIWMNNANSTGTNYVSPLLQVATDYDDIVAPTNNTTLTQFSNFKLWPLGNKSQSQYTHSFTPKVSEATTTVNVGGTTGTVLRGPSFINTETPDVTHTGFKVYWDVPSDYQSNAISDGNIQIDIKYFLTCKLVK